jgi:hypothetical protein
LKFYIVMPTGKSDFGLCFKKGVLVKTQIIKLGVPALLVKEIEISIEKKRDLKLLNPPRDLVLNPKAVLSKAARELFIISIRPSDIRNSFSSVKFDDKTMRGRLVGEYIIGIYRYTVTFTFDYLKKEKEIKIDRISITKC